MEFDARLNAGCESSGLERDPYIELLKQTTIEFNGSHTMTPEEQLEVIARATALVDPADPSPLVFRFLLTLALHDVRAGVGANRCGGNHKRSGANIPEEPIFSGREDPIFKALVKRLSSDGQ